MGDGDKTPLRLQFNPKVRLEFHGATITSDAGLLPIRELDDALGLTPIASDYLQESRTGRNIRRRCISIYDPINENAKSVEVAGGEAWQRWIIV